MQGESNEVNEAYHKLINQDGRIHLVPSKAKGIYFLRFAICSAATESKDVKFGFEVLKELGERILKEKKEGKIVAANGV